MIAVLLCAPGSLDAELRQSVLYRRDVQRRWARNAAEAQGQASAKRPDIVVVDSALPGAATLVAELREDPRMQELPIVALAREELAELELIEAGASAVLRLPPSPDWDTRLFSLMKNVPVRREARVPISLHLTAEVPTAALVVNLSANGMRVLCLRRLQVGDDLHFSFHLPGRPDVIQGAAKVVRELEMNQYGIELVRVDGEGQRLIREFFETGSNAS